MTRRPVAPLVALALGLGLGLDLGVGQAAEGVAPSAGPGVTAPAPVRRAPSRQPGKPPPMVVVKENAQAPPPRVPSQRAGVSAPVPDRNLEGPRVVTEDRARLGPSVINRNLPGRGLAGEGGPTLLEEKLFRPAPGAQLRVPFSY